MNQRDFNCSFAAMFTDKEGFEGVTKVSEWWAKNVDGDSQKLNNVFTVRFGETSGTFKIIESVPNKKITWQVINCYLPIFNNTTEWNGTTIGWEISGGENLTTISFTHIGLTPEKECYNDCVGGWTFYVKESLFKLITEGKGLPGLGIRSTISNGNRIYKGTLFFKNDPLPDFMQEFILIDVKEIKGEHVISSNSVERLDKKKFNSQKIKGNHYLLVEDKPVFDGIDTFEDILETVKK